MCVEVLVGPKAGEHERLLDSLAVREALVVADCPAIAGDVLWIKTYTDDKDVN